MAQWHRQHLCSAGHSGVAQRVRDLVLPQLWRRSQLWLRSDPWPGNSICRGAAKKEKRKKIYIWVRKPPILFSQGLHGPQTGKLCPLLDNQPPGVDYLTEKKRVATGQNHAQSTQKHLHCSAPFLPLRWGCDEQRLEDQGD